MVNAITGEIHGDRPYSVWKISAAVIASFAVVGAIAYFIWKTHN
jgi:hypothetical protein